MQSTRILVYAEAQLTALSAKVAELRNKAAVVAKSLVTLLSGVAVLVTTFSADIASVAPEGYATTVAQASTVVLAWLSTAIVALRRVTPVPADERGVLPQ